MPISIVSNLADKYALAAWTSEICRAADQLGCPVTNSKYYGRWMWEAGFVDIVEKHFHWHLNTGLPGLKQRMLGIYAHRIY